MASSALAKRLINGNLASWVRIVVMLVTQIAVVPIFLRRWDKEEYGMWLAIQTLASMVTIFDFGYQEYLQNEFLQYGEDRAASRKLLWSTLPVGVLVGFLEIVALLIAFPFNYDAHLVGIDPAKNPQLLIDARWVLMAYLLATWLFGSVSGIASRAVTAYGYYGRMSWWSVWLSLLQSSAPAIVVWNHGTLMQAGIAQCIAIAVVGFGQTWDMWRIMLKEQLEFIRPDFRYGLRILRVAQGLTLRSLVDRTRQQGSRLLLIPMVGPGALADFSTMRTGANVAFQALGTITGPIMPELMRYLRNREQAKVEASFAAIWMVVLAVLAPGTLALQFIAPALFHMWTKGKIAYDPVLFAGLSISVIVLAASQPCQAIAKGYNLTKVQLRMSLIATGVTLVSFLIFVKFMGIRGASLGLLLAEAASFVGYAIESKKWLLSADMNWPRRQFAAVVASTVVTSVAAYLISVTTFGWVFLFTGVLAQGVLVVSYWRSLPAAAQAGIVSLIKRRGKRSK